MRPASKIAWLVQRRRRRVVPLKQRTSPRRRHRYIRRMRLSLAVAVAATLGGVLAPAAFAHAEVTSSVPGYAEFVAKAPEQIVLTFDEPVRPIAGNAVVEGSSLSVLSGPPRTAPGRPNVLLL